MLRLKQKENNALHRNSFLTIFFCTQLHYEAKSLKFSGPPNLKLGILRWLQKNHDLVLDLTPPDTRFFAIVVNPKKRSFKTFSLLYFGVLCMFCEDLEVI